MDYRNLGETGLTVSRLIFGGARIGEQVDEATTRRIVHAAWDRGINSFYTADTYNAGAAEEILGKVIKERRQDLVLLVKAGYRVGSTGEEWTARTAGKIDHDALWRKGISPSSHGQSRKHLMQAVEASLSRLQTDYIDVYRIHFWDPLTPIEETLRTMDDLVRQGKVRYIGCSQTAAWQLYKALWVSDLRGLPRVESLQVRYNLLDRFAEKELLPACKAAGVGVLAFGSLAGDLLTGDYDVAAKPTELGYLQQYVDMYWKPEYLRRIAELSRLAAQWGRTPGELAQGWALARDDVTALLIGPHNPEALLRQVKAVEKPLTPEEWRAVDALAV